MTKPLSEDSVARQGAGTQYGVRQLFRRPAPLAAGIAIFEIKVFEDDEVVTAGDGKFKFDIPSDLDGSELIDCEAWVTGPSSAGDVIVSLFNDSASVDMLSTSLRIDAGEKNDRTSGTPFVINLANSEVAYGDEIWINVDNAGADALGLGVAVKFTPSDNAAIALRGTTGHAGGITDFQGGWTNTTTYVAGDVVTNNNTTYVAVQDHTSDQPNDEPGVGTNWMDFWVEVGQIPAVATLHCNVYNQAGVIPAGVKGVAKMDFDCVIEDWMLLADVAGSLVVDIWKTDYAGYPPSVADSITASAKPTLSSQIKNTSATLTGWDTTISAGDLLTFYVEPGGTVIQRITLALKLSR